MGSYNILQEHGIKEGDAAELSLSPYWLLLVIRYAEPLTSSRARLSRRTSFNTGNIALNDDIESLIHTRSKLLISSDCISLDIDSSKSRYTQSLQAVLKPGRTNYLSEIMPGDWVFAWTMHGRAKYLEVIEKIKTGEPANDFDDGLKFVGKVQDIRKVLAQSEGGLRTVQYNLQGVGFSELDSSVFFDPNLSRQEQYIDRVLQDLSIPLSEVFDISAENAQKEGGININKMLPALIKAFIGEGVHGRATENGGLQLAAGAGISTKEAPFSYVVPDGVAELLGITTPSKGNGIYSYADILSTIQGLQKYEDQSFPNLFYPTGTQHSLLDGNQPNRHFTALPLKGTFLPMATSFDNKTVWNLLNEYLNPAVNEMYTAVRLTPSGRVMPTLVIRQLPFSTPVMTNEYKTKVTSFHELPRWIVSPLLVRSMDIGRSDSTRVNFVNVDGQPSKPSLAGDLTQQLVEFPPVSDPQDIKRHGLRPQMTHVPVGPVDAVSGGPKEWTNIRADFLLGQHLTLTGACSLVGVAAPISPGDNMEFDGTVFHLESVHHHCDISPDGRKSFTTQLQLSNGVRSDAPAAAARIPKKKTVAKEPHLRTGLVKAFEDSSSNAAWGNENFISALDERENGFQTEVLADTGGNPDVYLYSGVHDQDNRGYDPGITDDQELP